MSSTNPVVGIQSDLTTMLEWSPADLRQPVVDVELMRSFVAVVEHGGYTTAAHMLNKTQSAVSLQVKRLEERIGVQLFEEPRRIIKLTEMGKRFLPHARRVIRSNLEAWNSVADGRNLKGRVRVGTNQLYSVNGLPEVFSDFYKEYSGVQIELLLASNLEMSQGLGSKYDITLNIHCADNYSGIIINKQSPVWVSAKHGNVHLQDPLPIGLLPHGALMHDMALSSLADMKREWRLVYESSDVPAMMATVASGLAVTTCLPQRLTQYSGDIIELTENEGFKPLPECVLTVEIAEECTSPIAHKLADHIAQNLSVNL